MRAHIHAYIQAQNQNQNQNQICDLYARPSFPSYGCIQFSYTTAHTTHIVFQFSGLRSAG